MVIIRIIKTKRQTQNCQSEVDMLWAEKEKLCDSPSVVSQRAKPARKVWCVSLVGIQKGPPQVIKSE